MHSSLVRVQNVFGFFTSVAFVVGALVALSALLFPSDLDAAANVHVTNFRVYGADPPAVFLETALTVRCGAV